MVFAVVVLDLECGRNQFCSKMAEIRLLSYMTANFANSVFRYHLVYT